MNIDEIIESWKEDVKFDRTELGEESLRCSDLHAKYIEIYFKERAVVIKLQDDYDRLRKTRWEYWHGKLDEKTIRENGWDPQPLSILKSDINMYLDTDEKLSGLKVRIQLQEEKVKFVDSIIKHITNRGFNIKNAVEYEKFKSGM